MRHNKVHVESDPPRASLEEDEGDEDLYALPVPPQLPRPPTDVEQPEEPAPKPVAQLSTPAVEQRWQQPARLTCWAVAGAAISWFAVASFLRPTRLYSDTQDHDTLSIGFGASAVIVEGGEEQPLVAGLITTQVVFYWLPTLLALLAACGLMWVSEFGGITPRAPTRLGKWVRHVLSTEVPPRKFWAWATDGLSVLDLLLATAWIGLQACWLVETFQRTWAGIGPDGLKELPEFTGMDQTGENLHKAGAAFGWVSAVDLMLLFFPVSRSSFLHWLFDTDFPRIIRYHRWMAHGTLWIIAVHSLLFYVLWWREGDWPREIIQWDAHAMSHLAGSIAFWLAMLIWVCSLHAVRRRFYELFYKVHIIAGPLFLLFSVMHYKYLIYYLLPGLVLYILDSCFRLCQNSLNVSSAHTHVARPPGTYTTLELTFAPGVRLCPAQFVYITVPEVNRWQRHPFSIAEVSRDPLTGVQKAKLHVKSAGDWTRGLLGTDDGDITVMVEGPYGCEDLHTHTHDVVVLVAGGSGATPILSILQDLAHRKQAGTQAPTKVYLVWSARNAAEFAALMPLVALEAYMQTKGWLDVQLFESGAKPNAAPVAEPAEPTSPQRNTFTATKPAVGRRQLHGRHIGWGRYALAATLSFLGAFGGLLPAAAVDAKYARTTANGAPYMAVALLEYFGALLGALLPTLLLVVLPTYLHWRRRANRVLPQPSTSTLDVGGGAGPSSPNCSTRDASPSLFARQEKEELGSCESGRSSPGGLAHKASAGQTSLNTKPSLQASLHYALSYELKFMSSTMDAAAAAAAAEAGQWELQDLVLTGRPNVSSVLQHIRNQHAKEAEVMVVCAGPASLRDDTRVVCQDLNHASPGPLMLFEQHTFAL